MGKAYLLRHLFSRGVWTWLTYAATVTSISVLTAAFVFGDSGLPIKSFLWLGIALFAVAFLQGLASSFGETQEAARAFATPDKHTYLIDESGLRAISQSGTEWYSNWDQFVTVRSTSVGLYLWTPREALFLSRAHLNDEIEGYILERLERLEHRLSPPCERLAPA